MLNQLTNSVLLEAYKKARQHHLEKELSKRKITIKNKE